MVGGEGLYSLDVRMPAMLGQKRSVSSLCCATGSTARRSAERHNIGQNNSARGPRKGGSTVSVRTEIREGHLWLDSEDHVEAFRHVARR